MEATPVTRQDLQTPWLLLAPAGNTPFAPDPPGRHLFLGHPPAEPCHQSLRIKASEIVHQLVPTNKCPRVRKPQV